MNKTDLINILMEEASLSRSSAKKTIEVALSSIEKALLEGESVHFLNFGTLRVIQKSARRVMNPTTQLPIEIASKKSVRFRVGKGLEDKINAIE